MSTRRVKQAPSGTRANVQARVDNIGTRVQHHPSRSNMLPTLYQVSSHPLVKPGSASRIFVYTQDTSKAAMEKVAGAMKGRKVPLGSNKDAFDVGGSYIIITVGLVSTD